MPPPATETAPVAAERTQRFTAHLSEFEGLWIGEMGSPLALTGESDTYAFPSGSSRIALDLSMNDSNFPGSFRNQINATLTLGEAAVPPPPDATVGYPEGYDYGRLSQYTLDPENESPAAALRVVAPLEGYPYRVERGSFANEVDIWADPLLLSDGVLRLSFVTAEYLDPWCQLQTPIPLEGGFTCAAGDGYISWPHEGGLCRVTEDRSPDPEELAMEALGISREEASVHPDLDDYFRLASEQREILSEVDVDCNRLALCRSEVCTCDESSCEANVSTKFQAQLVVRRVGGELVGVFEDAAFLNARGLPVPAGEVRLQLTALD